MPSSIDANFFNQARGSGRFRPKADIRFPKFDRRFRDFLNALSDGVVFSKFGYKLFRTSSMSLHRSYSQIE